MHPCCPCLHDSASPPLFSQAPHPRFSCAPIPLLRLCTTLPFVVVIVVMPSSSSPPSPLSSLCEIVVVHAVPGCAGRKSGGRREEEEAGRKEEGGRWKEGGGIEVEAVLGVEGQGGCGWGGSDMDVDVDGGGFEDGGRGRACSLSLSIVPALEAPPSWWNGGRGVGKAGEAERAQGRGAGRVEEAEVWCGGCGSWRPLRTAGGGGRVAGMLALIERTETAPNALNARRRAVPPQEANEGIGSRLLTFSQILRSNALFPSPSVWRPSNPPTPLLIGVRPRSKSPPSWWNGGREVGALQHRPIAPSLVTLVAIRACSFRDAPPSHEQGWVRAWVHAHDAVGREQCGSLEGMAWVIGGNGVGHWREWRGSLEGMAWVIGGNGVGHWREWRGSLEGMA
ncbi:hypothetical protein FA13DRAFT_1717880, partial [Coprinellus micaceus]